MDDRHVNTVDQPMELYSSAVQVSILPFVHKCRNRLSKPSVQINRGQMRVTVWTRDTVCWVAVTILGQVCGKVQNSHNLVLLWENLPSALECQLSQEKLSRRTRASVTLPGSLHAIGEALLVHSKKAFVHGKKWKISTSSSSSLVDLVTLTCDYDLPRLRYWKCYRCLKAARPLVCL